MRIPKGFIQRAGLQQFCLCSCRFDTTVVHNNDPVGVHDAGEPMGNDDERFTAHEPRHALLNDSFILRVSVGGCFVKYHNGHVSIARAILKNAPIIILDEATASIDPENERLIQQALSELTRGKTVITIAHRLATIEQVDQILVIDDGKVVQHGTHAELATIPGKYKKFIDIRRKSEGWNIAE